MQMSFTFSPDGSILVESISLLEDLWHDYLAVREIALTHEGLTTRTDRLLAKRYLRIAVLLLNAYLEGVVNSWLKALLDEPSWEAVSRLVLASKIGELKKKGSRQPKCKMDISSARVMRKNIAHGNPGVDLELYNSVTSSWVFGFEADISNWLTEMESILGMCRHPDTRKASEEIATELGTAIDPKTEGYTG